MKANPSTPNSARLFLPLLLLGLLPFIPARAAENLYGLAKVHVLLQTSNSAPVDAPLKTGNGAFLSSGTGPYGFTIGSPVAGSVTGPGAGSPYPLTNAGGLGDSPFGFSSPSLSSLTGTGSLNALYPDGLYTFKNSTGTVLASVSLTGDVYPNVPQILAVNGKPPVWSAQGQLILDPSISNTLTWSPFTATNPKYTFATGGFESIGLVDSKENPIVPFQNAGGIFSNLSPTPVNSLVIPANTMTTAQTYTGAIGYGLASSVGTVGASTPSFALYGTENDFTILASTPAAQFLIVTTNGQIAIRGYPGSSGAVVIPGAINGLPVTSIGEFAFNDNLSLMSITIPNTVTSIGDDAFAYCSRMKSVTLPNNVTSIGEHAFSSCSSLTSITIPNSVTSIGDGAFANCSRLTGITIPNGVTTIGEYAFYYCSSLTSITIPNSVTSIGNEAFFNCSSLTSITIPNSVTSIGELAFVSCSRLTSITLPNSVTSMGEWAFAGCSDLTSITIPNSVTTIGEDAFEDCTSLTSITISNGVTSIGDYAFSSCSSLTSITIPNSVTSMGEWAFSVCSSLTSITIPTSVTSIEKGAFSGCSNLTSLTIPTSVTSIGDEAFNDCTSLTSLTIPDSVTTIGNETFNDCSRLTSLTLPNSVASIGEYAFSDCSSLTSAVFNGSAPRMGLGVFAHTAAGFKVSYYNGAIGFTTPTWKDTSGDTYPAINLAVSGTHSQTITFPAIGNQAVGTSFSLSATASSVLPVTYSSTGNITISGNTAQVTGVGTASIRAHQIGNGTYAAAPSVLQTFTVTQGSQTITFPTIPNQVYPTASFSTAATASSGLPLTYTTSGPVRISGNFVTITGVGTVGIRAHQAGNSDYAAAPTVLQTFTVTKAP